MVSEGDLNRIAEDAAEKAADKAISNTFKLFGVDITDQRQVNEFRSDLVWARGVRRLSERVSGGAVMTILSLVVSGLAIAAWEGFKHFTNK